MIVKIIKIINISNKKYKRYIPKTYITNQDIDLIN